MIMDQQKDYQFIQVPINLFYLMDANCSKVFTTLIQMDSFYPKEDGYFECAYKTLELACGMSRPVIKASLAGLYLERIVDVVSVGQGRGKHTNRYKVNVEKFKDYEKINLGIAIMTEDKPIHQVKYKGERFQVPWNEISSEKQSEKKVTTNITSEKQSEKGTEKQSEKKVTTNIDNIENIDNTKENNISKEISKIIGKGIGKKVTTNTDTLNTSNNIETIDNNIEIIEYEKCKESIMYFVHYHDNYQYILLSYNKDKFMEKYRDSVVQLEKNIELKTGSTVSNEVILNYLYDYVQETGVIH